MGEEARAEELHEQLDLGSPPAKKTEPSVTAAAEMGKKRKRALPAVEDWARRRLIRQASAANQAAVKGDCLMAMRMLTRCKVLSSRFS